MSKVYLGVIFTLLLGLGFGFWQYSSVLESLGELEQANRQLLTDVNSMEDHNQKLIKQQKQASDISSEHHEKALQIINAEMLSKQNLLQYKIKKLKAEVASTIKEGTYKEQVNEQKINNCAESFISDFYLKQL